MSGWLIIPAILLVSLALAIGNYAMFKMINEVNKKLPKSEHLSWFWSYPGKSGRVLRSYRQQYPTGALNKIYWWAIGLLVAGFITYTSAAIFSPAP
jgi:hypothetical protein